MRICSSDKSENRAAVADFKRMFAQPKSTLDCYSDPWDPYKGAVVRVIPPGMGVFHAVFWPIISLVCGFATCSVFCRWCRRNQKLDVKVSRSGDAATTRGDQVGIEIDGVESQELTPRSPGITVTAPTNTRKTEAQKPGDAEKHAASSTYLHLQPQKIKPKRQKNHRKPAFPRSSSSCARAFLQESCVDASKYIPCSTNNEDSSKGSHKWLSL